MDTLPPASTNGSAPLNGWKEIAGYLGKSVRAVQRWEQHLGLPVHRIKTPEGQAVYAFRQEIDKWRLSTEPQPEAIRGSDNLGSVASVGSRSSRRVVLIFLTIAGCVVLLVAALVFRHSPLVRPETPSQVVVSGDALVGLSKDGRKLWSYRLGWIPQPLQHSSPESLLNQIQADIDGDGIPEILVVTHAPDRYGEPWREIIFCLSSSGELRWSYTPTLTLSFGGKPYEGPWRFYAFAASTPEGPQRVWASFGHHNWWPSFIVELDARGTKPTRYIQAGAIYTMNFWRTESHSYLVAGGVHNGHGRASVAVLDVDGPPVGAPEDEVGADFRCGSCPAQRPELFALLPRTEVNEVADAAYNIVSTIRAMGTKCFIDTVEAPSDRGGALYFLHNDLTFHDAALDDNYWKLHRLFEREERLDHAVTACRYARVAHVIRIWKPIEGWSDSSFTFKGAIPVQ